jgi:hypothetical protein
MLVTFWWKSEFWKDGEKKLVQIGWVPPSLSNPLLSLIYAIYMAYLHIICIWFWLYYYEVDIHYLYIYMWIFFVDFCISTKKNDWWVMYLETAARDVISSTLPLLYIHPHIVYICIVICLIHYTLQGHYSIDSSLPLNNCIGCTI